MRYFGTDGFRGKVGETLTAEHAYKIGRFIAWYTQKTNGRTPRIVIGKDTRKSSYMLEYAMASGIAASGGDANLLHVVPTPAVAYITKSENFDFGIMISASHNPYDDNGIKIMNANGEKAEDTFLLNIENYLDGNEILPYAKAEEVGRCIDCMAGRNRYMGYLLSLCRHSFENLRIGLDLANGSTWSMAKAVFSALGAKVYTVGDNPNGININDGVGSTHIETLQKLVLSHRLDVGFAYDGDGDRCLAVDENGNILTGDHILYIAATHMKKNNMLAENTVAATVMSNCGLAKSLAKHGISVKQTDVGDRYVYECMKKNGYALGGEQTGHIIFSKYATTGDGILTSLMLTEIMQDEKTPLGKRLDGFLFLPQETVNFPVQDKEKVMTDKDILNEIQNCNAILGENGRMLFRKSGTEMLCRLMTEAETTELCHSYNQKIEKLLRKKGYIH